MALGTSRATWKAYRRNPDCANPIKKVLDAKNHAQTRVGEVGSATRNQALAFKEAAELVGLRKARPDLRSTIGGVIGLGVSRVARVSRVSRVYSPPSSGSRTQSRRS